MYRDASDAEIPQDPELDFEGQGQLLRDWFEPNLGKDYLVRIPETPDMTFTLIEVSATRHDGGRPQGGFILLFEGPEEPFFMEGAARMQGPDTRWVSLYLSNTGPKAGKMQYEAVVC